MGRSRLKACIALLIRVKRCDLLLLFFVRASSSAKKFNLHTDFYLYLRDFLFGRQRNEEITHASIYTTHDAELFIKFNEEQIKQKKIENLTHTTKV